MMNFLVVILLFAGWGWQEQPAGPAREVSLDEEFTIQFGQRVEVKGANLRITFTAVEEDSRCPVEAACVWVGNVKLGLEVKRSKKKLVSAPINTTLEPREIAFKGYRVRLLRVSPDRHAGIPIAPGAYAATLIVSSK